MAAAWKHFSADVYNYDAKTPVSTYVATSSSSAPAPFLPSPLSFTYPLAICCHRIQLREGAALDDATRVLSKCVNKKYKVATQAAPSS
jgi:hypothetical protein